MRSLQEPILPTNIRKVRKVRGRLEVRKLVTPKPLLVNKEMLGWLNASLKCTETSDEFSTTLYLQSNKSLCQDACQR